MRLRTSLLLLLGISIAVGYWLLHVYFLHEKVKIQVAEDIIETPISVIVLVLLGLSIIVVFSFKVLSLILFFPSHFHNWKKRRAERKRNKYLTDGLQAMVLGIKQNQYKNFLSAGDAGVAPAITYYLAAAMTTNTKRQTNLLRKAAKSDGDPMVKAMAIAQLRLLSNQPAEAAEVLRIAGAATHKAVQPVKLLLEANEKSGDLRGSLDVAAHLLEREPTIALRQHVGRLTSKLLAEAGNAKDVHGLLSNVQKSGQSPNLIAIVAAKRLAAVNDQPGASNILRQAFKNGSDANLLIAIADFGNKDLVRHALGTSEDALRGTPKNTGLMRAFAELFMREKLWGQSRRLLENALAIVEERSTYLLLAKLAEAENLSATEANRLYRKAAQIADPEPS